MKRQLINGDMKVWDVIQDHPETYGVFLQFGCPDIRQGMFAVSAHFMKLRAAAHAHHFDLDELLKALNKAIARQDNNRSASHH